MKDFSSVPRPSRLLPWPVLLVCASLAGCATPGDPDEDYSDRVRYETSTLEGRVVPVNLVEKYSNDILRVQVTVENPSVFETDYQYKFRWLDGDGMEVAPEGEPWKPKKLPGRGRDHLNGVAPNPSVESFELRVRS